MKLNIRTLYGFKDVLTLKEADPTLREIRDAIAQAVDTDWYLLNPVINLKNDLKIAIKLDSDPGKTF